MQRSFTILAATVFLAGTLLAATTTRIGVRGMTCAMCARGLQASLSRVPGVQKVVVSFKRQQVLVVYNPQQLTLARLRQLIAEQGFKPLPTTTGK
jgi:mercuric ion binding protein